MNTLDGLLTPKDDENCDTFPLTVNRDQAWIIQQLVHPGMPIEENHQTEGLPALRWQSFALALRRKINNTILRFEDETETAEVEIDITEDEAWILDQALPFDGKGGPSTDLLVKLFRGMWYLSMGGIVPLKIVAEPPKEKPEESDEVNPQQSSVITITEDDLKRAIEDFGGEQEV